MNVYVYKLIYNIIYINVYKLIYNIIYVYVYKLIHNLIYVYVYTFSTSFYLYRHVFIHSSIIKSQIVLK